MCHRAREYFNLLRKEFGDSIISRNCYIEWSPRNCDLTPLDFFLWSYLKSLIYVNKPDTIRALKANIYRGIHDIWLELVEKVLKNLVHPFCSYNRSREGHLNDIVCES